MKIYPPHTVSPLVYRERTKSRSGYLAAREVEHNFAVYTVDEIELMVVAGMV